MHSSLIEIPQQIETNTFFTNKPVSEKISIILHCYHDESHLPHSLDSILMQCPYVDLEIIIIDNASKDKTQEIIQDYIKVYPNVIRSVRFEKARSEGSAINTALSMALGEFIAFVNPASSLTHDFLSKSLKIMKEEEADIACFDTVKVHKKENFSGHYMERWEFKAGLCTGEDSLKKFLTKEIGDFSLNAKLFRTSFLKKFNIQCIDTYVFAELSFALQAFYHSCKTILQPSIACKTFAYKNKNTIEISNIKRFDELFTTLSFLEKFFSEHNLDLQSDYYQNCLKTIYQEERIHIINAFTSNKEDTALETYSTCDCLLAFGQNETLLKLVLEDFAKITYSISQKPLCVAKAHRDWKKDASTPWPAIEVMPYVNANSAPQQEIILSVIVPCFNGELYLRETLSRILVQLNPSIEVIIIDDASTDNTFAILQELADQNPHIRLFQMKNNCRQGICRNIGIEKAQGKYITFVDSDDYVKKDFFATAIANMQENKVDICIYSVENLREDRSVLYTKTLQEKFYTNTAETLIDYFTGKIHPEPHAKVYLSDFLRKNAIKYTPYIYHQDQPFFFEALCAQAKVCTMPKVQYSYIHRTSSSVRPKEYTWLHAHSACLFFGYMQKVIDKIEQETHKKAPNSNHISWNINNIFMPICASFLHDTNSLPISKEDMHILQNSPSFLYALLLSFVKTATDIKTPKNILSSLYQQNTKNYKGEEEEVVISVIIPVYNQEHYLGKCLEALLHQPFSAFEILIVDDASTDFTPQVCQKYAQKDSRIKLFKNEKNSGQGISRNLAMKKARGKYITFVDSDDIVAPSLLIHGVCTLENMPDVDFVFFNYNNQDVLGNIVDKRTIAQGSYVNDDLFIKFCEGQIPSWAPWTKVFRKAFLSTHNIDFPDYLFEDNLFIIKAYYYAQKSFSTGVYGYTRIMLTHEASAMNPIRTTSRHIRGICHLLYDFEVFFNSITKKEANKDYTQQKLRRIAGCYTHLKSAGKYIDDCAKAGIMPFTDEDLTYLCSSPTFLKIFFEDFAKSYAQSIGHKAHSTYNKTDTRNIDTIPKHLLTILDRVEEMPSLPSEEIDISVIVPAYNVADSLGKCLDSILLQQSVHFEIILIEDNSTKDNTFEVCHSYATKHKSIRFFQTPYNAGLGQVRNLGLEKARGRYITYVDSDDSINQGFFEHGLKKLEKHHEAQIFICNTRRLYHDNLSEISTIPNAIISGEEMLEAYIRGKYAHYTAWASLYRKEFLERNKIQFTHYFYEDKHFLRNAYLQSKAVILSDFIGYNYHCDINKESIMRPKVRTYRHYISSIRNLEMAIDFFNTHTNLNPFLEKTLLKKFTTAHHHINSILLYIHNCKISNQESPLNDEILQILGSSTFFFSQCLLCCAQLQQQVQKSKPSIAPSGEELKHSRTQIKQLLSQESLFMRIYHAIEEKLSSKDKQYSAFGGQSCALLIRLYQQEGFEAVKHYIEKQKLLAKTIANTYTILAKEAQKTNKKASAKFSRLAFDAEPRVFRLKFLTFAYYKAGNKAMASICLNELPAKTQFNASELKIVDRIKNYKNK